MSRLNDLRRRGGELASRLVPGLDEWVFNRSRDRVIRSAVADGGYAQELADLPPSSTPTRPRLVVVPQIGPNDPTWKPAGGNFFYEIAQAAREVYGEDLVEVFEVNGLEPAAHWHQRLIRHLVETEATHVIVQVESDPNSEQQRYTWDILWSQLHTRWNGVFLGLVTDSYFTWIRASARRLARMSDRFVLVDICKPMDGVLVPGRPEVGPVNMPVSTQSLQVIDAECAGIARDIDVSFIGALYPYRVALLDEVSSSGARVVINPHRAAPAGDYASSSTDRPSYVDYMRGLARSRITINFSQENAGLEQQLKTRILEATAMGCLVLTDDVDRTELFWTPETEYGFFSEASELPAAVESWLQDPARLDQVRLAGERKARRINSSSFWNGVDDVLRRRGLPALTSG